MRIAVVAIVKDEALYIKEWIAYHSLRGLMNFIVYDNESSDETASFLKSARGVNIEVKPWPCVDGVSPQLSAYNDAIAAYRSIYDFLFFFDVDEFLLPTTAMTIPEILTRLPADISAIGVNQHVFGSSGRLNYEPGLVIERFQRCAEDDYQEHVWIKSCYRPSRVAHIPSSHLGTLASGRYGHPNGAELKFYDLTFAENCTAPVAPVDFGLLQLNHYMLRSREEFLAKRAKGSVIETTPEDRRKRYDMGYFEHRDGVVNARRDPRAAALGPQVRERMAQIWPDMAKA